MFASYMIVPTTIIVPGQGTNSVGDPVDDWDNPASQLSADCWLEPLASSEDNDARQSDVQRFRLFYETTVVVPSSARVLVNGLVLQVQGPSLVRRTVRGVHHQEVRCVAVTG